MKRVILTLAIMGMAILPSTGFCLSIGIDLVFDSPDWSGSASYDNTTAATYNSLYSTTIYRLDSFQVTNGTVSWELDELDTTFPEAGAIVDPFDRIALKVLATDTVTNHELQYSFATDQNGLFNTLLRSYDETGSLYSASYYTASAVPTGTAAPAPVPEPSTFLLLGAGLTGLGLVVLRKRKE